MKTKKRRSKKVGKYLTEDDLLPENIKFRVNMFMDMDIVEHFRLQAKRRGLGYQTLINQALRDYISGFRSLERRVEELEKLLKK